MHDEHERDRYLTLQGLFVETCGLVRVELGIAKGEQEVKKFGASSHLKQPWRLNLRACGCVKYQR